jgi:UDP-N-acetylmuramate dehydrogenase
MSGGWRERVLTALRGAVPEASVEVEAPLARLTTMRVGGPADLLVTVKSALEVERVAAVARACEVPLTVLGGGSNVVVADAGIRGIVLRLHGGEITQVTDDLVRADAGVTINGLVRWLASRGLAGLEAWAGTPGTVGGAIHGNAHFQGRLISEHVHDVRVLLPTGRVIDVPARDMAFAYDRSRLQGSDEVALSVRFMVTGGADPEALRNVARTSLAFRKRTQPLHQASAGCIFQNPDESASLPVGVPRSAGALIDRVGMKGTVLGGAQVSPLHANFVTVAPGSRASDVRSLVERCRRQVQDATGVRLEEEIVYLGEWT